MLKPARIVARSPYSGKPVGEYEPMSPAEARRAVEAADAAFRPWARRPLGVRSDRFRVLADVLTGRADALARIAALEMGKPVAQGRAEVLKCAWACRYFADHAAFGLADEPVATEGDRSLVVYRPLGVILAIMPWNFPFWQAFRFAVPALMAGNAMVLKHASNVPGCARAIETQFRDAGFPDGLVRALLIGAEDAQALIEHPFVRAVTLTGSSEAGAEVAARAGRHLKKTVLELGGSDPYLVLEDADLDAAADLCAEARLVNAGQSCVAAKRFIVVGPGRAAAFENLLAGRLCTRRLGDPLDPTTELGPLARHDLRDAVHRQVEASRRAGARLVLGGAFGDGPGAFYLPTVLGDVRPGMPAFDEEVFGPVAAVVPAADEAEAIWLANASRFGLGAAVLTRDLARGERIAADELEAGNAFVNLQVASDPRLPFGGVKDSGYGRELSIHGLREFVNVKTVRVRPPA
ncbi:MAG TPA: NAD-dependent succinate-semialdehyde dehydrogenase [Planctomycetota bacterium]|nr:NAD-dependent succinate-semialdehyde dehydrogenase [Planctomycetota bacterium]